jgi:hypothetical protein
MAALEIALRILLGVVFGVAFLSKVRSRAAFREFAASLRDISWLGVTERSAVGLAIPALEIGTVLLLAMPSAAVWGFATASVLLAAFTAVTGRELARGRRIRCRCFGAGAARIGAPQIVRNLVLLAGSCAGLLAEPVSHGAVSPPGLVYAVGLAMLAAMALVRWDDLVLLVR